jgi:hypothetical protein
MSRSLDGGIFLIEDQSRWHDPYSDELKELEIKYLIDEHNYLLNKDKSELGRLYNYRQESADQEVRDWKDTSEQGISNRTFTTIKHNKQDTLSFETYKTIRGWQRMITRMNGYPISFYDAAVMDKFHYNNMVVDINSKSGLGDKAYIEGYVNWFSDRLDEIQDLVTVHGLDLNDPEGPPIKPPATAIGDKNTKMYRRDPISTRSVTARSTTTDVTGGRKKYKKTYKTRKHRKHRKHRKSRKH